MANIRIKSRIIYKAAMSDLGFMNRMANKRHLKKMLKDVDRSGFQPKLPEARLKEAENEGILD